MECSHNCEEENIGEELQMYFLVLRGGNNTNYGLQVILIRQIGGETGYYSYTLQSYTLAAGNSTYRIARNIGGN